MKLSPDDIGLALVSVVVVLTPLAILCLAISAIAGPPQVNWWMP